MLVALNGFKSSGKDTVANILIEEYGFQKISFAAKLKESAAALFDIEPSAWEAGKNDPHATISIDIVIDHIAQQQIKKTLTVREFLQRYGTESHRDVFGYDFWVEHAFKGVHPNDANYVVTDCRFENEINKVRSLDGVIVRVLRDSVIVDDKHASEEEPPDHLVDFYIDNNGTIEALETSVRELYENVIQEISYEIYED